MLVVLIAASVVIPGEPGFSLYVLEEAGSQLACVAGG
jgi:hypothetical protein